MSDFERADNSWDQAERFRHAARLRQLKAELQEVRRRSHPTAVTQTVNVFREQPSQPDPGIIKKAQARKL